MKGKMSLKTQNMPLIVLFLAWSVTLYILFLIGFKDFWSEFVSIFDKINAEKGFLAVISPLFAFVLLNFMNNSQKSILVFWKVNNPMPGSRAFTEIAPKDARIDMDVLKEKLGDIPTDPAQQNRTWYKLYKQVDDTIIVYSSHKNFLLARELTSLSFLFLIFTPWLIFIINKSAKMGLIYTLIWILQYLTFCKVAQNTGERFVSNVIAEYCCMSFLDNELNNNEI